MEREKLGSRLGFILLSAGCAIGCGNVWKFPWMCGQNGGGAFVLIYVICLILLGLPIMTMEFALGRASKASPVRMHKVLTPDKPGWQVHGYGSLVANVLLMMFYTVVTGWMLYYFVKFLIGENTGLSFGGMIGRADVSVGYMAITVIFAFIVLSFGLQKGLERVTKYMMIILLALMIGLAVYSCTLEGGSEGLKFYLIPDFSKITLSTIVAAMNQSFFTLSLGIGSMAIFGSYIGKERSLAGESVNVIVLDTAVALIAGLIIFPACYANNTDVGAGPGLLFDTMAGVFSNMGGAGRIIGTCFFLFMVFAAMSTVLAVCENIMACVMELTGFNRRKTALICGAGLLILSVPCALGFNLWSGVQPFGEGTSIMDLEDFLVSNCMLPLGSLAILMYCILSNAWGFKNFLKEANTGKGLKFSKNLFPFVTFVLPVGIFVIFLLGILNFFHITNI